MNVSMWRKALQVIPRISKEEWDTLDVISRWLIATRSAVLVMTFISAAIAGLLAARDGHFNLLLWLLVTVGLLFAHATNNLVNDFTDHLKGVDKDNYFRAQYGPQPLEHGLMTKQQLLTYAAVTGLIALAWPGSVFFRGAWAALRTRTAHLDLPIAIGMIAAADEIPHGILEKYAMVGELALSGEVRRVKGVLPIAIRSRQSVSAPSAGPATIRHPISLSCTGADERDGRPPSHRHEALVLSFRATAPHA